MVCGMFRSCFPIQFILTYCPALLFCISFYRFYQTFDDIFTTLCSFSNCWFIKKFHTIWSVCMIVNFKNIHNYWLEMQKNTLNIFLNISLFKHSSVTAVHLYWDIKLYNQLKCCSCLFYPKNKQKTGTSIQDENTLKKHWLP